MIALPKHKMTADEFMAWAEAQPKEAGKFELWDGEVILKHGPAGSMNAQRAQHWMCRDALYRALYDAIKMSGLSCFAVGEGPTVRISKYKSAEPDALVYCGERVRADSLEVPNPVVVCEVLSPNTAKFDMGEKLRGYFTVHSIHHCLIVDPDKPLVIHHKRAAGQTIETTFVGDKVLRLDPPGLDVDLTEIFAG